MPLLRNIIIWWQSPELPQQIGTYAVCACGIHTDVKADKLICPHCRLRGVKETPDGKPGEFTMRALYRPKEGWAE
jgi:hypothetical protein